MAMVIDTLRYDETACMVYSVSLWCYGYLPCGWQWVCTPCSSGTIRYEYDKKMKSGGGFLEGHHDNIIYHWYIPVLIDIFIISQPYFLMHR